MKKTLMLGLAAAAIAASASDADAQTKYRVFNSNGSDHTNPLPPTPPPPPRPGPNPPPAPPLPAPGPVGEGAAPPVSPGRSAGDAVADAAAAARAGTLASADGTALSAEAQRQIERALACDPTSLAEALASSGLNAPLSGEAASAFAALDRRTRCAGEEELSYGELLGRAVYAFNYIVASAPEGYLDQPAEQFLAMHAVLQRAVAGYNAAGPEEPVGM